MEIKKELSITIKYVNEDDTYEDLTDDYLILTITADFLDEGYNSVEYRGYLLKGLMEQTHEYKQRDEDERYESTVKYWIDTKKIFNDITGLDFDETFMKLRNEHIENSIKNLKSKIKVTHGNKTE